MNWLSYYGLLLPWWALSGGLSACEVGPFHRDVRGFETFAIYRNTWGHYYSDETKLRAGENG